MDVLATRTNDTNQRLDHEKAILSATVAKLDATLAKLTQCHQEAIRLQSNSDARFRLMITTAKGRLEQVERLKTRMVRYEDSLGIASPTSNDTDAILSKSHRSTTQSFEVIDHET